MPYTAFELNLPPLSSIPEFAALVGYSPTRIERCAKATETDKYGWPPLRAKRMPDGQLRIPAAAGAEWINHMRDA